MHAITKIIIMDSDLGASLVDPAEMYSCSPMF